MRIRENWIAGDTKRFSIQGNFVRLTEASAAVAGSVNIELFLSGQRLPIDLIAAEPGDWARALAPGFDHLEITSTVNQTLALQVLRGDVGSDSVIGNVGITGIVTTREVGSVYGSSYASNTLIAAGGTSMVFSAAANPNGAVIWSAQGYTVSAGANAIQLLANAIAPISATDGDVFLFGVSGTVGVGTMTGNMPVPIQVQLGKGLWWRSSGAETGAMREVLYTLL